ncbi:MAG: tetratricopeptide repeat protein [bacterium]
MEILYTKDEIQLKIEELRDYIKSDDLEKLEECLVIFSKYGLLPDLRDTLLNYIEKKFLNSSNYEAAFLEYQKALAIFPEDDEIFEKIVNISEVLINKNSSLISKSEYRVIVKSYIKLLSLVGKFNKALNLISSLVSQNPDDVEILLLSAEVYETEGQIDKAVSTYLQIIDKLPKDQQIKIREQISIIDPTNKDNLINLVELYINNKDYQTASRALRNYLRYNQNDLDIISKIAEVDMLVGNYRSALVASKKALDADPNNPKYKYVYAVVNYYNKTNLSQVETILDEILPELVNMKLLRESQEAFKILSSISDSYHYKYFELVSSLEKEFKEKEVMVFKDEEKVEKEEIEAVLNSTEIQLEAELTNKSKITEDIKENQEKIQIEKNQLEDKGSNLNKLESAQDFLEKRETFSSLRRRSTGVYLKKDFGESKSGEKKLLIKENTFTERKEFDQGIKKGFLPKQDSKINQSQKLLKDNIQKPTLESKPVLKLEKTTETKSLTQQNEPQTKYESKDDYKEIDKVGNKFDTVLKQLDDLSATETINIQQKIQQNISEKIEKVPEKIINKKIEEVEIKIETIDRADINIEVEIFEKALNEIIKNLEKTDVVIFTMLKLIDNVYELSKDKLKLALWVTRILNIAELFKLNKIKQKLIQVLKELNYYKIASYINYSSNVKNTYSYLFELLLESNFEDIQNNIKEYFRTLIIEKLYFTFNQFYNKLITKFENKKELIDEIIVDLFKESKNEIDFILYFINENPSLKSKLPKEILVNLVKNNEIELNDEELIDILIYLMEQGNFNELLNLVNNIKDFDKFVLNFIKSINNNKQIDELYNSIKNEVNEMINYINNLENQRSILILLAYLSSYDTKEDLLDLSLLFNELFKKVVKEKIYNFKEFIKILTIVYVNVIYLPLNILFLVNEIDLLDNSILLKKENILKIYILDVFLRLKKYKENEEDLKNKIYELEDLLATQQEIDNQATILGILSYINYYLYLDKKVENYKEEAISLVEKIDIILDDVTQKLVYFFYLALRKLVIDDDKVSLLLEKENLSLSDLFFVFD